jgi:microcystin-dependent protein
VADPFVGEIRAFPFNFAPKGWAFCDGQILPISQNTALFSLLGTTYGGDGKSTFALPNLQGSAPIAFGQGPGLSLYDLGGSGGEDTVTLLVSEIPAHNHPAGCNADAADSASPGGEVWAPEAAGSNAYGGSGGTAMAPSALSVVGGSLPHNNLQPYLVLNYCIALQGIFPARS